MSPAIVRGPWKVKATGSRFVVQYLEEKALRFGPWTSREHALHFCSRLNRRWLGSRAAR